MDTTSSLGSQPSRRAGLRSPTTIGLIGGGVVVAAVLAIVLLATTRSSPPPPRPAPPTSSAVYDVTHVPASVLDAVGVGGTTVSNQAAGNALAPITGGSTAGNGIPAVGGKPVVFYFGALWCPYCATERWSVIVALSRFGTFSNLGSAVSSADDVYPSTQTWSFHGASYASSYVVFQPVEFQGESQQSLDTLDAAQLAVLRRWDPAGSFPFLTIGTRFTAGLPAWDTPQLLQGKSQAEIAAALSQSSNQIGQQIDANANYLTAGICAVDGGAPAWDTPQLLQGKSQAEIAAALSQSSNQIGQQIDANANYLTAGICAVDGGAPASVCGSAGVQAAAALLPQLPAAKPISG